MQGNSLIETINGFDPIPIDIYNKKKATKKNLFDDIEINLFDKNLYDELVDKIHIFYGDVDNKDKTKVKEGIKDLAQRLIFSYIKSKILFLMIK